MILRRNDICLRVSSSFQLVEQMVHCWCAHVYRCVGVSVLVCIIWKVQCKLSCAHILHFHPSLVFSVKSAVHETHRWFVFAVNYDLMPVIEVLLCPSQRSFMVNSGNSEGQRHIRRLWRRGEWEREKIWSTGTERARGGKRENFTRRRCRSKRRDEWKTVGQSERERQKDKEGMGHGDFEGKWETEEKYEAARCWRTARRPHFQQTSTLDQSPAIRGVCVPRDASEQLKKGAARSQQHFSAETVSTGISGKA